MNAPARKTEKSIKINLAGQVVEAYMGVNQVLRFDCVSGDKDHPTNRGIFKITRKEHPYRSRAYNVQMDYALFFTLDGKALHQYHGMVPLAVVRTARNRVSDWFGSHGCVRLAEADAKALYKWASVGTTVRVF